MARHLLMRNRSPFTREGNEGGGGGGTGGTGGTGEGGQGGSGSGSGDGGGTGNQDPPKTYTPPATQEEFDRIIGDRVKQERRKYPSDWEQVAEDAQKWRAFEAESKPEREREKQAAADEARREENAKLAPRLVRQAFKAEAKGVLTQEQVTSLLEDLDLSKYLDKDGDVDEEKVAKKVKAFAPANGGQGQNGNGRGPGFGQGSGHNQSTTRKGEAGLNEAKRRFPDAFASKS